MSLHDALQDTPEAPAALALAPEFLQELTAGSWEANRLIARAIGWTSRIHKPQTNYDMEWEEWIPPGADRGAASTRVPDFSRDLTDAFSLEPEDVRWCLSGSAKSVLTYWFYVFYPDGTADVTIHACRELAVCIGFLQAHRALKS